jgi:putative phosphoesterase
MTPVDSGTVERVGLIGDVHGAEPALRQALGFLAMQPGLDAILCTGDLPVRQGKETEPTITCCRILAEAGVLTVRGNHDRWHVEGQRALYPDDAFDFLASLPPSRRFETPRGPVLLCHGIGDDDMSGVYQGAGGESRDRWLHQMGLQKLEFVVRHYLFRLILNGHTHLHMAEQHGKAFLVNAGTLLADKEPPTVSVVDFAEGWVRFYGLDLTAQATTLQSEMRLP